MRFTDVSIRALKAKAARYEVWETGHPGFGVRVSEKGRKTFIYVYRFEGRARRHTLGRFPKLTLAQAHVAYAQARASVEAGVDPGRVATNERHARRTAPLVSDLASDFLERRLKITRPASWRDSERTLAREVLPYWGTRKAEDISRRDVLALLDSKVDSLRAARPTSRLVAVNRLLWLLKRMFEFGVERDILKASPCSVVRPIAKERQRDRVLSEDEIGRFLVAVETTPLSEGVRIALRLALATGQRRGEVAAARQAEFDLSSGVWSIPGERTKSGRSHTVPLSPMALTLVQQAMDLAADSEWLFPSPVASRGHIEPHALSTAVIRMLRSSDITGFTVHDLRRTAASHMTGLGFPRLVVAKILNHADQGAIAVYDRYAYSKEKRAALVAWAIKLDEIASGKRTTSVVPFKRS